MRAPFLTAAVIALCGTAVCGTLVGCGGSGSFATSGGQTVAAGTGRATLTLRWPTAGSTRLIPFAANSIRVRLTSPDGSRLLGEALLVRPAGGGAASAAFDRLPAGPMVVTASAYPASDGTGVIQAGAQVNATIVADQVIDIHLTLASTIDHIESDPTSATLAPGGAVTLVPTAKDSLGATILTSTSTISWKSDDTSVATVDAAGLVTAIKTGSATITATETESGKFVSVPITVTNPAPQVVYSNDFQGAVGPEWSFTGLRTDPLNASDKLLGSFVNATVRLSLSGLPAHNSVTVAFDLYILNSWDGNGPPPIGSEIWSLTVANGGPTLLYTNFNNNAGNQAYPGTFPTDSYPARTGAIFSNESNPRYTVYRITKTFSHTGSSVAFDFAASGLEELAENEGWALDDVQVSVQP